MCKVKEKLICIIMIFVLCMQNISFGSQVVNAVRYADELNNFLFVGDSYTQMMPYYFGSSIDWEGHEGYTVEMLSMYMENVAKKNKENIVFFIGPNDYLRQVSTDDFYDTLVRHIRYLKANTRSRIFFCSYLDFMYNVRNLAQSNMEYSIEDYDTMIQLLCQNEGIIYLNLWDIGDVNKMRGLSDTEGENDMFHYGKAFYEEFFVHLKKDLARQEEKERTLMAEIERRNANNINVGTIVQNTQNEELMDPSLIAANLTKLAN